jgi:hypothetical protein
MTGMTRMQLIAQWLADAKGSNSHTTWNTYLKYFSANKETEAAQVSSNDSTIHSTAFHAQCYAKYQEVSDWQEHLALFEELEVFSTKGITVAQRNRTFRQFEGKLKKIVCSIVIQHCVQHADSVFDRLMPAILSSTLKLPTSPEEALSMQTKGCLHHMRLWTQKR